MSARVVFVCPFNLDRLTGTPVRTRSTIEAVRGVCDVYIVAAGGSLPQLYVAVGSWQERNGRHPLFRLDRFTKAALRELEAFKPNVVHAITTPAVLPSAIYKLRHRGTRLVFEMHGLTSYEMRDASWYSRLIYGALDRVGSVLADTIVAMSYTQRDLLCQIFGVRAHKVHIIWGPVDVDLVQYRDPLVPSPFYVGYLGNDTFWQGLDTILAAAHILQDSDIHFLLAGFDPSSYAQLGLRNTTFGGIIPRGGESMFLAKCHVLLSTRIGGMVSKMQYPHKLSYYLAAGRPIIASDVNDQPLILKEADCGMVFPAQNAQALAEAIVKIRDHPEERRLQMGLNARRFAERHLSMDTLAKNLIDIYLGKAPGEAVLSKVQ